MIKGTFTHCDLSGRFWQINVASSSTFSDLNVQLKLSAPSSVHIVVFCVRKVFNNFNKEKTLNREKNLCFATDFSPDFVNRKALTRVLTTGYLPYSEQNRPEKSQRVNVP
jgi:hypothetical protein